MNSPSVGGGGDRLASWAASLPKNVEGAAKLAYYKAKDIYHSNFSAGARSSDRSSQRTLTTSLKRFSELGTSEAAGKAKGVAGKMLQDASAKVSELGNRVKGLVTAPNEQNRTFTQHRNALDPGQSFREIAKEKLGALSGSIREFSEAAEAKVAQSAKGLQTALESKSVKDRLSDAAKELPGNVADSAKSVRRSFMETATGVSYEGQAKEAFNAAAGALGLRLASYRRAVPTDDNTRAEGKGKLTQLRDDLQKAIGATDRKPNADEAVVLQLLGDAAKALEPGAPDAAMKSVVERWDTFSAEVRGRAG